MAKQGNSYAIKKIRLDELKDALKESLTLHITCSQIQRPGANLNFMAVERPTFCNPIEQTQANPEVLTNSCENGLDEVRLRLLARLCAERASAEEPRLIVDEIECPCSIRASNENIVLKIEEHQPQVQDKSAFKNEEHSVSNNNMGTQEAAEAVLPLTTAPRMCIGLNNARVEQFASIDLAYCARYWSNFKGSAASTQEKYLE